MPDSRKIATCCYCGMRAVLVLDKGRHELGCAACGAPLHNMKFMPKRAENKKKSPVGGLVMRYPVSASRNGQADRFGEWGGDPGNKRKNKRKPMLRRVLEELWDEVEDIFD